MTDQTGGIPSGAVPPYEPNPAFPQSQQHHDPYTQNTINNYPQETMANHTPMSSPPIDMSQQKQEYYNPGGVPPQPQHQVSIPMQQQVSQYQMATPIGNLGEGAAPVDCPACRTRALTRTSYHSGNTTNAWAAVACICLCLGCIPYLIRGLKDVDHHCGHCGVLLATWHNSGRLVQHQH